MKLGRNHVGFKYHLTFVCLLLGLWSCNPLRSERDISEFAAIPQNALWVMRFNNLEALHSLGEKEAAVGGILSVADSTWTEKVLVFEHWMKNVPFLSSLGDRPFSISSHAIGKVDSWLFAFAQQPQDDGLWLQLREKGFKTDRIEAAEEVIYLVCTPSGEQIYASFVTNNLLMCRSKVVLESAIHQIKAGFSLASSHDFAYAYKHAKMREPISMWVNLENLSSSIQPTYNVSATSWIRCLHSTGKWMAIDLDKEDKNFVFEGLITQSPAEMSISAVWKDKEEFNLSVWSNLPANAKQAWIESVRNSEQLVKKMIAYRDKSSKSTIRLPQITQQLIAPKEVSSFVQQWDPQSVSLVNLVMGDGVDVWMTLTHCGRVEAYHKAVIQALGSYNEMNQLGDLHLVRSYALDTLGTQMKVYANPFKYLYPYIYGELYTLASDAYIGFYDDYAVMGPTQVSVVEWVQSIRAGRVLENMDAMQSLKDEAETKGIIFYFLRPDLHRTSWVNALQKKKLKSIVPVDFEKKWRGLWLRIQTNKEYLRLEGAFIGRNDQDTMSFSAPVIPR